MNTHSGIDLDALDGAPMGGLAWLQVAMVGIAFSALAFASVAVVVYWPVTQY